MKKNPVLLVHGIDDTNARFRRMKAALLANGFPNVYAMDIVPPNASITVEAMGQQIDEAVRSLCQGAPDQKVDIVAFSMGALAVRYFLQRLGGRALVRRFISICGPHRGTLTAYFRPSIGVKQMRPGSALIRDLNTEMDPWGGVEVFSFWSPLDLMIIPATSALLSQAQNHAFTVPLHPWMVSDERVIKAVMQTLEKE